MGEKKMFLCQNPSCKKTFTTPLKTINLQDNPTEPYYACPFCLTRIESPELKIQPNQQEVIKKPVEAENKQILANGSEKPAACQFHLGYLSERAQKEIPDNCLVCTNIVECMLRKMRD